MMYNKRRAEFLIQVTLYLGIAIFLVFFWVPLLWMGVKSFQEGMVGASQFRYGFKNYVELFTNYPLAKYTLSSVVVGVSASTLAVIVGSLAAYALARLHIRGRKHIIFWILSNRFFPLMAVAIPYFIVFARLGLLDTRTGLILIYTAMNLPLVVWVMRTFFLEIPLEIEEAAMVDGCTRLQVLIRVCFPLVIPALTAVFVLSYIFCWNEFLFAHLLTDLNARTLPVAVANFQTDRQIFWGMLTAAGTIAILPPAVMVFLVRKSLVRGLSFGVMK